MRRICVELQKPFFEVEQWPVSELAKWAAHFVLEHEEFEAAKQAAESVTGTVIDVTRGIDSPELQSNAVMALW